MRLLCPCTRQRDVNDSDRTTGWQFLVRDLWRAKKDGGPEPDRYDSEGNPLFQVYRSSPITPCPLRMIQKQLCSRSSQLYLLFTEMTP